LNWRGAGGPDPLCDTPHPPTFERCRQFVGAVRRGRPQEYGKRIWGQQIDDVQYEYEGEIKIACWSEQRAGKDEGINVQIGQNNNTNRRARRVIHSGGALGNY